MSDMTLLRIGIAVAMSVLLGAIIYFGRSRNAGQGRRVARATGRSGEQQAPDAGAVDRAGAHEDVAQDELPLAPPPERVLPGKRVSDQFDRIVTLYVAAKAGCTLRGPDILVAAEKAGLTFGYMDIFHRLVDGRPELGPIFSVANIIKPGSFDLTQIDSLETPALAFFLTLPAPVPALDAWETMEPAAQRMADLLDGVVLDEDRNALGRQRIQYIRDELRAYDRQNAAPPLARSTRW